MFPEKGRLQDNFRGKNKRSQGVYELGSLDLVQGQLILAKLFHRFLQVKDLHGFMNMKIRIQVRVANAGFSYTLHNVLHTICGRITESRKP